MNTHDMGIGVSGGSSGNIMIASSSTNGSGGGGSSSNGNHSNGGGCSNGNGREFSDSKRIWDALKEILGRKRVHCNNGDGPLAPVHEDAWEYNMKHTNRGKALIFNHRDYEPSLELASRIGTEVDKEKLTECLTHIGFQVQTHTDLCFDKLRDTINTVAKEDHKNDDCLLVVVLSHGKTDLLYAYDMSYNPEILWEPFSAEKCPDLAGKPKMFFIQACRGDKYDDGTHLQVKRSRMSTDNAKKKFFKVPNQADFLVVFSCVPGINFTDFYKELTPSDPTLFMKFSQKGHYSWRNHIRGSWFIQSLCKILSRYHEDLDMLNMITLVNQEVAVKYESNRPDDISQHGKKQVPHVTHTLLRQIFFTSKKIIPGQDSWV